MKQRRKNNDCVKIFVVKEGLYKAVSEEWRNRVSEEWRTNFDELRIIDSSNNEGIILY